MTGIAAPAASPAIDDGGVRRDGSADESWSSKEASILALLVLAAVGSSVVVGGSTALDPPYSFLLLLSVPASYSSYSTSSSTRSDSSGKSGRRGLARPIPVEPCGGIFFPIIFLVTSITQL